MKFHIIVLVAGLLAVGTSFAQAGVWHVDSTGGNDQSTGQTPSSAFRTIQRAANVVQAGDTVIIHPGLYFEQVRVNASTRGTAAAPIVFRADAIGRDRVILSGAAPDIRTGSTSWTLVDSSTLLYAANYPGETPARVTYSHVDLYPYGSLAELNTFTTAWEGGTPGPRHGFFHDVAAQRLYVRLHASGRYGSTDPNQHRMAVSPVRTKGRGISILGRSPAHVIIEGITFEASGDSAIYTEASNITVRDSWFFGCAYGVRGTNRGQVFDPTADPYEAASEIIIEHCEFSEFSTYNDATELLLAANLSPGDRAPWSTIWHRKSTGMHGLPANTKNYENGIAVRIGRDWVIRHNHIHDIFEGLANDGMTQSFGVRIHDNVFARICDNAIETENHARDVRIYRNLIVDAFEPFSYQPGGGVPWPGPIWFYQNVVANTPAHAAAWQTAPHGSRGLFKLGISLKNWANGRNADVPQSPLIAPSPGLLFFNNSFHFPHGRFINLMGSRDVPIENVLFAHNVIAADFVLSTNPATDLSDGFFIFRDNVVASAAPGAGANMSLLADSPVAYRTDFGTNDGFFPGALHGQGGWTVTPGAGQPDTYSITTPGPGAPSSPGGGDLLWVSPMSYGVSANQTALLTFADATALVRRPFTLSFDIFASATGGAGQSMTFHLGREGAVNSSAAPQFSFSSVNPGTFSLNVRDAGTWNNSVATLAKNAWLRFEIKVVASASSGSGTYGVAIHELDASGAVVSTVLDQPSDTYAYTLSNGFGTLRLLTNSSRTDYWIDRLAINFSNGLVVPTVDALGWIAPDTGDFKLRADSPGKGLGGVVPGAEAESGLPDAGALQPGDTWFPPQVGPRVNVPTP